MGRGVGKRFRVDMPFVVACRPVASLPVPATQKVEGSSPFIRFSEPAGKRRVSHAPSRPFAIDATIIRSILLPAVMRLLGEWNWYLPRWLEWLPDIQIEARSAAPV